MMEVFQNGRFSTGEPVYQIRTNNPDGTYDIVVFELMSKAQAEAKLATMQPSVEVPPKYASMTKLQLETLMRGYGVELDRRRTKASLLEEVREHFNG